MQPATTTTTAAAIAGPFSAESTMAPSSPMIPGAIDPLLDASLITDAITPLASGPCADAGHWFCCVCTMGPHLEPHNVGCGNCGHVKCAGCKTK